MDESESTDEAMTDVQQAAAESANGSYRGAFSRLSDSPRSSFTRRGQFDQPDLPFQYSDCDILIHEIGEIFSYSENDELVLHYREYKRMLSKMPNSDVTWSQATAQIRRQRIQSFLQGLDVADKSQRYSAFQALLYVLLGAYMEAASPQKIEQTMTDSVYLMYDLGVWHELWRIFVCELENEEGVSASSVGKLNMTHCCQFRWILCGLCVFADVLCRENVQPTGLSAERSTSIRAAFIEDINLPVDGTSSTPIQILFDSLTRYCSATMASVAASTEGQLFPLPVRKVLLLLWKLLLAWLGTEAALFERKQKLRDRNGLPPSLEMTIEVAKRMRAAPTDQLNILPSAGESSDESSGSQGLLGAGFGRGNQAARRMAHRQFAYVGDSNEEDAETVTEEGVEDDDVLVNCPSETTSTQESRRSSFGNLSDLHRVVDSKTLPWASKIRERDIAAYMDRERMKFFGYRLDPNDSKTTAGFPRPIFDSLQALRRHVYTSLAEVQVEREQKFDKYRFSMTESLDEDVASSRAELLYQAMLPRMTNYVIALLKLLLFAAPMSRSKNESINVSSEVCLEEEPQGEAEEKRQALDIERHKEIMVKSISAILLLLLKHFKVNHIYQFEFISQQLVFSNSIPLLLKFFDQNILRYILPRNELPELTFPTCVLAWAQTGSFPKLDTLRSAKNEIEIVRAPLSEDEPCWRTTFAAINLLRILNKLTKWNYSRTMLLVVFKSAAMLKRALRVRHILLQLYALKLLKMQARYLGRQWRKTNMDIMSAIYSKVRHRLIDDWAFANETTTKPWDYEQDECNLRASVERFNRRRYAHLLADSASATSAKNITEESSEAIDGKTAFDSSSPLVFEPTKLENRHTDFNVLAAINAAEEVGDGFRANYTAWLEREVFRTPSIDWDLLLPAHLKATAQLAIHDRV